MLTLTFTARPYSFPLPEMCDKRIESLVELVDALDKRGPLPRCPRTNFPEFTITDEQGEEVAGG